MSSGNGIIKSIISHGDLGNGMYYISASINDPEYYSQSLDVSGSLYEVKEEFGHTFNSDGDYVNVAVFPIEDKDQHLINHGL